MTDENQQVVSPRMHAALDLAKSSLAAGYSFAGDRGIDATSLLHAYGLLVGQWLSDEMGAGEAAKILRLMATLIENGENLVGQTEVPQGVAH